MTFFAACGSGRNWAALLAVLALPACGGSDGGGGRALSAPGGSAGLADPAVGDSGVAVGNDGMGGAASHAAGGSPSVVDWGTTAAGGSGSGGAPSVPTITPFSSLITQSVPWADLSVSVTKVDLVRGADPSFPDRTDAELTIAITNNGSSETDYQDRDTWDLKLASGERIHPTGPLGVTISPTDTAKAIVDYPLPDGATLASAALILEGETIGDLEPERIPLDATWERQYPLEIGSLAGKSVSQPSTGFGLAKLEITSGFVDLNDSTGVRASLGTRLVRLDTIATAGDFRGGANSMKAQYRVVVDGNSYAPDNSINDLVEPNASMNEHVIFSIPADTQTFEILLNLTSTISMRFPVDIAKDGVLVAP